MTRARILHFIDTLGAGGTERQLMYLLEGLDPTRYESHVLTTYDQFRHHESTLQEIDVPTYSLHHGELTLLGRAGAIARYTRMMWGLQPQIVHGWLHYPNLIARAARPACPPHRLLTAIRTEYTRRQQFSERMTMSFSDFRIVNIPPTKQPHVNAKILYISNGVSLPDQPPPAPTSIPFTILMVARIDPRKDHLTLLHALVRLAPETVASTQTILIGEVSDLQVQRMIEDTITELSLEQHVRQVPPTHEIEPYYAHANVTVLPSTTEGFPNTILESFASARPVIVSQAANRNNIVTHNVNGWVFPTSDSQSLADTIEIASKTPQQELRQMGLAGYAVAKQYSIQQMVNRYEELYERALIRSYKRS